MPAGRRAATRHITRPLAGATYLGRVSPGDESRRTSSTRSRVAAGSTPSLVVVTRDARPASRTPPTAAPTRAVSTPRSSSRRRRGAVASGRDGAGTFASLTIEAEREECRIDLAVDVRMRPADRRSRSGCDAGSCVVRSATTRPGPATTPGQCPRRGSYGSRRSSWWSKRGCGGWPVLSMACGSRGWTSPGPPRGSPATSSSWWRGRRSRWSRTRYGGWSTSTGTPSGGSATEWWPRAPGDRRCHAQVTDRKGPASISCPRSGSGCNATAR
jgi:hypothetical protein